MSTPAVRLLIDAAVPHRLDSLEAGTGNFGAAAAAAWTSHCPRGTWRG